MKKKVLMTGMTFAVLGIGFGVTRFMGQESYVSSSQAEIIILNDRFEPETLEIKKGTTVIFKNEASDLRWPASNLHPTHTIYSEFDPKEPVKPGESWQFKFNKKGSWKYHDHLAPLTRGVITVK